MTIFITSDLHIGHKTMITCQWRKFLCLERMHQVIIHNWNKIVKDGDIVYVLGDVFVGSGYEDVFKQLKGHKIIIKGNHDKPSLSNTINIFIRYKGIDIEMVHNPIHAHTKKGIVLHGHHHLNGNHTMPVKKGVVFYNVNTEFHKYKPKRLSEIIGEINKND